MDPLSVTASIAAILDLGTSVFLILNGAKGASADRRRFMRELNSSNGLLTDLQFEIESRNNDDPWCISVAKLNEKDGPLEQYRNALEELRDKFMYKNRILKYGQTLFWNLRKEEIESILSRIERLKALVQVALQLNHLKLTEAVKDGVDLIRHETEAIRLSLVALRHAESRKADDAFLEWISDSKYPTQQSDFLSSRQEGTGDWFLNSSEFQTWFKTPGQTLFCPGIPGAGKTTMSAIAFDHISKSLQNNDTRAAIVYCNYKTQIDQTIATFFAAILKQLVQGHSLNAKHIKELHSSYTGKRTKPLFDEVYESLHLLLTDVKTVFVFVDALDECPSRICEQFVSKLKNLQLKTDVRLMFTSRHNTDIRSQLSGPLILEIRANEEDIRRFVSDRMCFLPCCIQRDSKLQREVADKIIVSVQGMFLLARLYLDTLQDKHRPREVRECINNFSKGAKDTIQIYDDAYDEALERINKQMTGDKDLALNLLKWIIHAKKQLYVGEITHALSVVPDTEDIDSEDIYDIRDAVAACAGLVTIDEKSKVVRLVHYTTQEYFERTRVQWFPNAHLEIASTCLTYLLFSEFGSGPKHSQKEFNDRKIKYPLLEYVARFWGDHAAMDEESVAGKACDFFRNQSAMDSAVQAQHIIYIYYQNSRLHLSRVSALHLIAKFGLHVIASKLYPEPLPRYMVDGLDEYDDFYDDFDDNSYDGDHEDYDYDDVYDADYGENSGEDSDEDYDWDRDEDRDRDHTEIFPYDDYMPLGQLGDTPLIIAAMYGSFDMAEWLINKGANVKVQGPSGNALCLASGARNEQTVKLLLDSGAEINAQDEFHGSALQAACRRGDEQSIKLLLNRGANINSQAGFNGNALQEACVFANEHIVKLLLDDGAIVNTKGGHHGNALQAACYRCHEQIIILLLNRGAEINTHGGFYGTPLQAASSKGNQRIVKLLLDKGADVNAQVGYFGTALQAACSGNHIQIVRLLLDEAADPNLQGGHFGNALYSASYRGCEQIINMLLEKGANINAKGGPYGNPLVAACYRGREQAVRLLLDKGADINVSGEGYDSPFDAAICRRREQIVKLLLDRGVDVNGPCIIYGSALRAASSLRSEPLVALLLDRGADVNAQNGEHGTALQTASRFGSEQIVRLLLKKYADVNSPAGKYGTALGTASCYGHEQIVRLLLEKGAEVNTPDFKNGTALQAASRSGFEHIVRLLLEKGARPDVQGSNSSSHHDEHDDHDDNNTTTRPDHLASSRS